MALICSVAICSALGISAPIPRSLQEDYYPTAVGSKWVYDVQFEDDNFEISRSIKSQVAMGACKAIVIDETIIFDSRPITLTVAEIQVCQHGIFELERKGGHKFDPPLCMLKLPVVKNTKWPWEFGDRWKLAGESGQRTIVEIEEEIEVPAGKYKTVKVEWSGKVGGEVRSAAYWYAKGTGEVMMKSDKYTRKLKKFIIGEK